MWVETHAYQLCCSLATFHLVWWITLVSPKKKTTTSNANNLAQAAVVYFWDTEKIDANHNRPGRFSIFRGGPLEAPVSQSIASPNSFSFDPGWITETWSAVHFLLPGQCSLDNYVVQRCLPIELVKVGLKIPTPVTPFGNRWC